MLCRIIKKKKEKMGQRKLLHYNITTHHLTLSGCEGYPVEVYWYTVGPGGVNSQAVHFAEAVEVPHKDSCIDLKLVMLRVPEP